MKVVSILVSIFLFAGITSAQTGSTISVTPDSTKKVQVVKTACGQCMFGMKADGCTLAVQIKGKKYFVEGTTIDDHGDAHAVDGFCSAIRKAEVQGEVIEGKFKATYFKLLPSGKGINSNSNSQGH